jgi:general secretion pathway protein G
MTMKAKWKMLMARVADALRARENDRLPRRRSAGFTLLEVMIVLAIIAAIASGVGVVVFNQYKKAQVKIAKERVKEVMQGVTTFMIDNNNCPQGIEQLVGQKYLSKGAAKDPWGKEFSLKCPGTNDPEAADVSSAGPDKQDGTPDDIKSWEL